MKQAYQNYNPRGETLKLINLINTIITSYQAQGFMLSVRQIYYQLVARDHIPNTEASYKRTASIINDARLGGYVDWDAIEDRNRDIERRNRWESGAQLVRACANQFHMDMWANQDHRVLVVVEKAALAGVLQGICRKYDVPMLAARGYPSVSIVREMALEHLAPAIHEGQEPLILHLGDHDPSGIDMTRDLDERLALFLEGQPFEFRRIALSMEQVREKNPPPNPAKVTDSRFEGYLRQYGSESWELDALEPSYMVRLVESQIREVIDQDAWEAREDEIQLVKDKLDKVADRFDDEEDEEDDE